MTSGLEGIDCVASGDSRSACYRDFHLATPIAIVYGFPGVDEGGAPRVTCRLRGRTGTVADVTLDELAVRVRGFAAARASEQFHTPKNLAMALAGEVGELVAELQWLTPEEAGRVMGDPEAAARMRSELGDVTIYLVRLADVLGVDLVDAARVKLEES